MTAEELCSRFNISRRTFYSFRDRYKTFPPPIGRTRAARYGPQHVAWIQARLALRHVKTSLSEADALCAECGKALPQYVDERERSLKLFGFQAA